MVIQMKGNIFEGFCDIICHQVNCQGVMGSGIAKEIKDRFPVVYYEYRQTYKKKQNLLGNIDVVDVCKGQRYIINMYSQDNYLPRGIRHTDYDAFRKCLSKIKEYFYDKRTTVSIGFPYKIGCGLGGGDWDVIQSIINEEFNGNEWSVEIWKL